jgi:hypothetical protein
LEDVQGLGIDGFAGGQAWPERDKPAVVFKNVSDAIVRNSRSAKGTKVFLRISGEESHDIVLDANDFRNAKIPYQLDQGVKSNTIQAVHNIGP